MLLLERGYQQLEIIMGEKITSTICTGKQNAEVKPATPMHYKFLSEVALDIYTSAKKHDASEKGALFVIAHAALESGWAKDALKAGDYNLFGMMTLGNDFIRSTKHGKVKDYSKVGGFKASMDDYFQKINSHQWSGFDLIKKIDFTYDDIDKAFNTGAYYPTKKELHDGKYVYNADIDKNDKKNHYGKFLYNQMSSVKKRMLEALDYRIEIDLGDNGVTKPDGKNETELKNLKDVKKTVSEIVL